MPTVKHAPRRAPKVTTTVQHAGEEVAVVPWLQQAHAIAAPLLRSLAAFHELGQRCVALERAAAERDDTMPAAIELVATVRAVADWCSAAARGCVTNDPDDPNPTDPDAVDQAMRLIITAITRSRHLALTTDAHQAWALVD